MYRPFALLCALLVSFAAVSSTCLAQSPELIRFTLQSQPGGAAKIHASFHHQNRANAENNWSTAFMPSDLIGLEVSSFHAPGARPLHFSIAREAGRLDCAGNGGGDFASGNCRFRENAQFAQLLVARGIARPSSDQMFALMAVDAHRELIDALREAHYPAPRVDDLIALSALGVDRRYISQLAQAGYRPSTLQALLELKALAITPEWIAGFARIGYANVPENGLVQLRALGITPEFITGFQRIGYRDLPVGTLAQLKALDITPQFVRSVADGGPMPSISKLAELKMLGKRR